MVKRGDCLCASTLGAAGGWGNGDVGRSTLVHVSTLGSGSGSIDKSKSGGDIGEHLTLWLRRIFLAPTFGQSVTSVLQETSLQTSRNHTYFFMKISTLSVSDIEVLTLAHS